MSQCYVLIGPADEGGPESKGLGKMFDGEVTFRLGLGLGW